MAELDIDFLAQRGSTALRAILSRLALLTLGLVGVTLLVAVATYASGVLAFDDGSSWPYIGVVICVGPVILAYVAWFRIFRVRRRAPQALLDLRNVLTDDKLRSQMTTLIDHDTKQPIVTSSRSFVGVYQQIQSHGADWPALVDSMRAVTTVPGLIALSLIGTVALSMLGAVLLIVGLLG